jgi:hypothetical protein
MTKASISLQELRRKIYRKAKTEKHWRFWGLYCQICKKGVLQEAYRLAKANKGAPGIDGKSFKIKGVYKYQTVSGNYNNVPHFSVIKELTADEYGILVVF